MEELLSKLPQWAQDIPTYLGVLVIIATALVRLPQLKKYEDQVTKAALLLNKIISWLPTVGKNPSTKRLEDKAKK